MNFKKIMCITISTLLLIGASACSDKTAPVSDSSGDSSAQSVSMSGIAVTLYSEDGETKEVDLVETDKYKADGWMEAYEFYLTKSFKEIYDYHEGLKFMYGYEGGYYFAAPGDESVHFGFTIGDFCDASGNFMDITVMENSKDTPMPSNPESSKCLVVYGAVSRLFPQLQKYLHDDGTIHKSDFQEFFETDVTFESNIDGDYFVYASKENTYCDGEVEFLFTTDENGIMKYEQGIVSVNLKTTP